MKKIIPLIAIALVSCSKQETPLETALRNSATDGEYTLLEYSVDTITNAKKIEQLKKDVSLIGLSSKEDFKEMRDNQFGFCYFDYAKDDSEQERKRTEEWYMNSPFNKGSELYNAVLIADSLLNNWDKVTEYSSAYNYTAIFFINRTAEKLNFSRFEGSKPVAAQAEWAMSHIKGWMPTLDVLDSLSRCDQEATYEYVATHKYSIEGKSDLKAIATDLVTLDTDLNVKDRTRIDFDFGVK